MSGRRFAGGRRGRVGEASGCFRCEKLALRSCGGLFRLTMMLHALALARTAERRWMDVRYGKSLSSKTVTEEVALQLALEGFARTLADRFRI